MRREEFTSKLQTDAALAHAKQTSDASLKEKDIEQRNKPPITIDGREQIGQVADEMRGMAQTQHETMAQAMVQMGQGMAALAEALKDLKGMAKTMSAPRRIVRGTDGRAVGVETVQ